jgi:hypothetical protein
MKAVFTLALIILAAGCTHAPRSDYRALDSAGTKVAHLKYAEATRFSSVSFNDVILARVAATFNTCEENPQDFQNTVTLVSDDINWSQQKVSLKLEDVNFAKLIDEICIQTGSVWRADREIVIDKKK